MIVYRSRRPCLGWPEIESCSRFAKRGSRYCKDCDDLRWAHGDVEADEPPVEEDENSEHGAFSREDRDDDE